MLAANQVSLAEVLEVKGAPLNEEEIWAVLSQASKAIERVLADGEFSNIAIFFYTTCDEFITLRILPFQFDVLLIFNL